MFIFHSLAGRKSKGIHLGLKQLKRRFQKESRNHQRACLALKMDIERFFDCVSHSILKKLLRKKVQDPSLLDQLDQLIDSFSTQTTPEGKIGMPIGNITSQIFANLYLHELDLWIKQRLKVRWDLRYCDDFLILSHDLAALEQLILPIQTFLQKELKLNLHPKKV